MSIRARSLLLITASVLFVIPSMATDFILLKEYYGKIKTIRLLIEQEKNSELPIMSEAYTILKSSGAEVVMSDSKKYDCTLKIVSKEKDLEAEYIRQHGGIETRNTGAELEGKAILIINDSLIFESPFHGKWSPPKTIDTRFPSPYGTPRMAAFKNSSFFKTITFICSHIFDMNTMLRNLDKDPAKALIDQHLSKMRTSGGVISESDIQFINMVICDERFSLNLDLRRSIPELDDPEILKCYISALKHSKAIVREGAANAINDIVDRSDIQNMDVSKTAPILIQNLYDSNVEVRRTSVEALGKILPSGEKKRIFPALKDSVFIVRWMAVQAVWREEDAPKDIIVLTCIEALKQYTRYSGTEYASTILASMKDSRSIKPLYEAAVCNQSYDFRWEAIIALGEINDPEAKELSMKALIQIIRDPQSKEKMVLFQNHSIQLREGACKFLGDYKDPKCANVLIDMLYDETPSVSEAALASWQKINDPNTAEILIETAVKAITSRKSNQTLFAGNVANAIKNIIKININDNLIKLLNNDNKFVRYLAVLCLGERKCIDAVQPFIRLLRDEEKLVSFASLEGLKKINDPRAAGAIISVFDLYDNYFKANAAVALGTLGNPIAVDFLIQKLNIFDFAVRLSCISGLSMLGDLRCIKPIFEAIRNMPLDNESRNKVLSILTKMKSDQLSDYIVSLLNDNDEYIQSCSIVMIGLSKDGRATMQLLEILRGKNENLKEHSAFALGQMCEIKAVPLLLKLLKKDKVNLKNSALIALQNITNKKFTEYSDWQNWWNDNKMKYQSKE